MFHCDTDIKCYAAYATATVSVGYNMRLAVAVPVNKEENGVIFEISSEKGDAEIDMLPL